MYYEVTKHIERIHACQNKGLMSRPADNYIRQFGDVAETYLRPFLAELASTLGNEGIGTEPLPECDPDTYPTVGIAILTTGTFLHFRPGDKGDGCHFIIRPGGDFRNEITRWVSYRAISRGELGRMVERMIERAICPKKAPF
jgi:hypothetical protein